MGKNKPIRPLVAVIERADVAYVGRARADAKGGTFVVIVKRDGCVVLHDVECNTKAAFYNPCSNVTWRVRRGRMTLESITPTQEVLKVTGRVVSRYNPQDAVMKGRRPVREHVSGVEADLVDLIITHPERFGLKDVDFTSREDHRVGGRVDLLFEDVIVEAKKRARIPCYDQIKRYQRQRGSTRALLVCLHASAGVIKLVSEDETVDLIVVSEEEFSAFLSERE